MKKLFFSVLSFFSLMLSAQQITSISPNSGKQGESLTIAITGQKNSFKQASNAVKLFGPKDIYANSTIYLNDSLMNATFAFNNTHPAGLYGIEVYSGTLMSLNNAFTLQADSTPAALVSVSPSSANQGDNVTLIVTASNANFTAGGNSAILYNDYNNSYGSVTVLNDQTLSVSFSFLNLEQPGSYNLRIVNQVDGTLELPKCFTLNASPNVAHLKSISPDFALQNENLTVTITGQHTNFNQASLSVRLDNGQDIYGTPHIINDSVMQANFNFTTANVPGIYDVVVQSPSNYLVLPAGFTLGIDSTAPNLLSVSPSEAYQGDSVTLTITGLNTHFGSILDTNVWLRSNIWGNYIYARNVYAINNTTLKATFEFPYNFEPGQYDVMVYNSIDAELTLPEGFTLKKSLNPPRLVSISPSNAQQGNIVNVTIRGANTHFTQGSVYANLYGNSYVDAEMIQIVDDSTLTAKLNIGYGVSPGSYNLSLYSYPVDGSLWMQNAFTVTPGNYPPSITNVAPNVGTQGATVTLQISGKNTHFKSPIDSNQVWLSNGLSYVAVDSIIPVNDTLLNAVFHLKYSYYTGIYGVYIYNKLDGTVSLDSGFTINAGNNPPKLKKITPASGKQGNLVSVSITGVNTNFDKEYIYMGLLGDQSYISPQSYTIVNATTIKADFKLSYAHSVGDYDVVVYHPWDGELRLVDGFSLKAGNSPPKVVSVSPKSAIVGQTISMTINCKNTNFLLDSFVYVHLSDGVNYLYPLSVSIVDNKTLKASFVFPANAITGNYNVYVYDNFDGSFDLANGFSLKAIGAKTTKAFVVGAQPEVAMTVSVGSSILVFPNPTSDVVNVKVGSEWEGAQIEIIDILGHTVQLPSRIANSTEVDLSGYPSGIYFIRLIKDNAMSMQKVIKN